MYRRPASGVAAGDAIPFFREGEFHLFHLASPPRTEAFPERVRTNWRHVRSRDLVDWEELPDALCPGEGNDPDADGAWTGSVIEFEGAYHIYYTGHRLVSATPQSICHAASGDLVRFTKDPANPLIVPDPSLYESVDWRDPYVFWNDAEQQFWMLIAARLNRGPRWRRGCIALATSPDLSAWRLEAKPLYAPATTFCPECPEIFRLGDRWYLVYSRFSENAGTIYRIADNPRGPWRVAGREALDGRRWYAAKSLPNTDASRIFFGWVHDRARESDSGNWLWGGDFAAARQVTADADGELRVRLPSAITETFSKELPIGKTLSPSKSGGLTFEGAARRHTLSKIGSFGYVFIPVAAESYLFSCRFRLEIAPASFGILFRTDSDLSGLALAFDRARTSVALVRLPAPLDTFWADLVGRGHEIREVDGPRVVEHPFNWQDASDGVEVQILVSGTVFEAYVNGQVALSYRVYGKGENELALFAEDGVVACEEVSVRASA